MILKINLSANLDFSFALLCSFFQLLFCTSLDSLLLRRSHNFLRCSGRGIEIWTLTRVSVLSEHRHEQDPRYLNAKNGIHCPEWWVGKDTGRKTLVSFSLDYEYRELWFALWNVHLLTNLHDLYANLSQLVEISRNIEKNWNQNCVSLESPSPLVALSLAKKSTRFSTGRENRRNHSMKKKKAQESLFQNSTDKSSPAKNRSILWSYFFCVAFSCPSNEHWNKIAQN